LLASQHQRYESFFLLRRRAERSPRSHHDYRRIFRVYNRCASPPANTGALATIAGGMAAARIAETNQLHIEATRVYRTYHNVDQAFKKLIINAFEGPYLSALSDEIIGYANCT
jgi:hypothetical protein